LGEYFDGIAGAGWAGDALYSHSKSNADDGVSAIQVDAENVTLAKF